MKWITVVLINCLLQWNSSGAQLTLSTSDAVCPGNRVILTCQQSEAFTEWSINLQPTLRQSAQNTHVGSVITFGVDRGFNFEIHVVSSSSNNFTTVLQVTAVRELDGVTVVCTGASGIYMSTIQVASVDPPATPSGVMATIKQLTKTRASVNVTWSTSRGADNYTVNVTPPIMPGQLSDFTTTDTNLLLMLKYVNYTINITAQNCAGSNSTIILLLVIDIHPGPGLIPVAPECSPPSPPTNGRINEYHNGSVGASLTFQCNTGYLPHEQVTSTCMANGTWVPIPQCILAGTSQTILAAVICSFVFFFLGVFVGVLCHRWGRVFIKPCTGDTKHSNGKRREHPSPTDTPADDAPVVYEEVTTDSHSQQKIELEENVAYGHI